jgi:hypothetical protein
LPLRNSLEDPVFFFFLEDLAVNELQERQQRCWWSGGSRGKVLPTKCEALNSNPSTTKKESKTIAIIELTECCTQY